MYYVSNLDFKNRKCESKNHQTILLALGVVFQHRVAGVLSGVKAIKPVVPPKMEMPEETL